MKALVSVCDIGSMPLRIPLEELRKGARHTQTLTQLTKYGKCYDYVTKFEDNVVSGLIDKIRAGVDVPSYPQYRDMNEMFLELIDGLSYTPKGYMTVDRLSAKPGRMIPEVYSIKSRLKEIYEKVDSEDIRLKICATGPYTLSTFFTSRTPELFKKLGEVLSEIITNSVFNLKEGKTSALSIDEPVFGLVDDPLLDSGRPGRECLRETWNQIARAASVKGLETMIHLHSTSDDLMWEVDDLDIIGSHVGDPLYTASTRKRLAETGKRLIVSVAVTKFDDLIGRFGNDPEAIGKLWTEINRGEVDPERFLEDSNLITERLQKSIDLFGEENLPYAGPECGLAGFPTYKCAVKYLQRISSTVRRMTK